MRLRLIAMIGILVVAGCGSEAPAASVAGAASPSMVPPAPSPQPTEPYAIQQGALQPGRYLQAGFEPHVSFVLGPGWQAYFNDADGAYLGNANGVELGVNRPPKVVDPAPRKVMDTPADLAAWLAENPTFEAVSSTAVTIDGTPAILVEADATGDQDLFAYDLGNFHTVPGARYRFYVIPMDGPDLLFLAMGQVADFEANLPVLEAIVDSIRLGE
jgi:hypothetical protein